MRRRISLNNLSTLEISSELYQLLLIVLGSFITLLLNLLYNWYQERQNRKSLLEFINSNIALFEYEVKEYIAIVKKELNKNDQIPNHLKDYGFLLNYTSDFIQRKRKIKEKEIFNYPESYYFKVFGTKLFYYYTSTLELLDQFTEDVVIDIHEKEILDIKNQIN